MSTGPSQVIQEVCFNALLLYLLRIAENIELTRYKIITSTNYYSIFSNFYGPPIFIQSFYNNFR